ncbi:MAG: branched-chain amino acid ABC transporter permease, partial [Alphaproteobacteria bacterium]
MSGAIHRGRAWLGHGLNAPLLLAGVAIVVYAAFFASLYDMRVLTLAGVYAILVLGYQFVFGHAGALSLAQGAFFGLGAYATGILGSLWGVGFQLTFPFSILVPGVVAALIAAPVLRLESHYFALATLAFSQAVLLLAVNWESVTGGANGLPGVPGVRLFGEGIGAGAPLLLFVWVWVALGAVIARRAMRGLYGQSFAVMRAAPLAAGTLGIDTGMLRYTAFVLSALYAGGAGALYVHTIRVVSPEVLGFGVMVICLTMTVVGGRTTVAGALVGALLLTHLPEWFRAL